MLQAARRDNTHFGPPGRLADGESIIAVVLIALLMTHIYVGAMTPVRQAVSISSPPDIIFYAVWLYYRFNLSHRDIIDLLAERGITVSHESIRLWCIKFGALYAKRLKRKHCGYGDTFYIDEFFVKINGRQHYLWRAVDQDGEVVSAFEDWSRAVA